MLIAAILGVMVGAVLGLSGAGGGILAVPALVFGLGWTMQQAAPVALIAVAGSAALGSIDGFRRKLVRYRAAILMAFSGVPLTTVGILVAQALPQRVLLLTFAAVMLSVAVRQVLHARGGQTSIHHGLARVQIDPATGQLIWSWHSASLLTAIGALSGFMTGLLGVGGGFVVVPMLRRFTNVTMHGIVATSLFVIALIGLGGVVSALIHGASFPVSATAAFTAATAGGMMAGRNMSYRLSPAQIQIWFASVLVLVAMGFFAKAGMGQ